MKFYQTFPNTVGQDCRRGSSTDVWAMAILPTYICCTFLHSLKFKSSGLLHQLYINWHSSYLIIWDVHNRRHWIFCYPRQCDFASGTALSNKNSLSRLLSEFFQVKEWVTVKVYITSSCHTNISSCHSRCCWKRKYNLETNKAISIHAGLCESL